MNRLCLCSIFAPALVVAACGSGPSDTGGGGSTGSTTGGAGGAGGAGGEGTTTGGQTSSGGGGASGGGASAGGGGGGTGGGDACADVVCTALDTCHMIGTCDPQTGVCSNPNADDGAACVPATGCMFGNTCIAAVCTAGDPANAQVDQSQLVGITDTWNLATGDAIGEIVTVGKTGLLTGIEVSVSGGATEAVGSVQVDVYDATNTLLGSALIPVTAVAGVGGGSLNAATKGPAYFDLSSQCIGVTAGQVIHFDASLKNVPGTCVGTTCVGGTLAGNGCTVNQQCSTFTIHAAQPSTYAGGSIVFGNAPGSSDDNIAFKTFVE